MCILDIRKKGVITINADQISEDDLMLLALESGAEDIRVEDDSYEIVTTPADYAKVKQALTDKGIKIEAAEITMHPKNTVRVEGKDAEQLLKLVDALEDHDDIKNVYSNFDIDVAVLEQMG